MQRAVMTVVVFVGAVSLLAAGHRAPTPSRVGECIGRRTCEGITSPGSTRRR